MDQLDSLLNFLYFAVGLAVGLYQLHSAQRQFEAQQRERTSHLERSLNDIQQRLAIIQEISTERAYEERTKLIDLATRDQTLRDQTLVDITEDTGAKIKDLIQDELERAGMHGLSQHISNLEAKINEALVKSASSIIEVVEAPQQAPERLSLLTPRELQVLKFIAEGKTTAEIALINSIQQATVRSIQDSIRQKLGVRNVAELIGVAYANNLLDLPSPSRDK